MTAGVLGDYWYADLFRWILRKIPPAAARGSVGV